MKSLATTLMLAVIGGASFGQQAAPYFESFDGATQGGSNCTLAGIGTLPMNWSDGGGTGSWTVWSASTGSGGTGPSGDANGPGNYVYTEGSSGCSGSDFILVSPAVDMSASGTPGVAFRVHMVGSGIGDLVIEETDGLGGWVELGRISGALGDNWFFTEFALSQTSTQVRWRHEGSTNFACDLAIDNVFFGDLTGVGNNFPVPTPPTAPEFQPNSTDSALDLDTQIDVTALVGDFVNLNAVSSLIGSPHEIFVSAGGRRGLSEGGLQTGNLQTFNLDVNPATLVALNQSTFGTVIGHPGFMSYAVFGGSEFTGSAQQLVANPANSDGYTLSAAVELSFIALSGANQVVLSDDDFIQVPLTALTVPFMGTSYSSAFINSNGTVSFGGGDITFGANVIGAQSGVARFGVWTDLNPVAGGFISYTETASSFDVFFQGVPYFGEAYGPTFSIAIGSAGIGTLDVAGWVPNLTGGGSGDRVWMGVTGGGAFGATDGGASVFTIGSVSNAVSTDMLYDFADAATIGLAGPLMVPGQLDSITNVKAGSGLVTFVPGANPGDYTATGM